MGGEQPDVSTTPSSGPDLAQFKAALHSSFVVRLGSQGAVTLTLEEINESGSRRGWESFNLIFDGPSPPAFMDGLFEAEHAQLGTFLLFVVAVHTDGDGQQYQAVFHRPST
jgi:hypothetical protein